MMNWSHIPTLLAKSKSDPALVVLLHGYGANGQDLLSLGHSWQQSLPSLYVISPDAPMPCVMNPDGFQWFPLFNFSMTEIEQGLAAAVSFVSNFLEQAAIHYSIPPSRIVLGGFSQGAMLSLYTALRLPYTLGGVLAMSGLLAGEIPTTHAGKLPIALFHGSLDTVVPVSGSVMAEQLLKSSGFETHLLLRPHLMHGIDEACIDEAGRLLQAWLPALG
jgi:phospholipase/carboxylesterase